LTCKSFSKVIVATDSHEIAEVIQKVGGHVEMTPPELPTGTDRVAFVAQRYPEYSVVVNLQGDEPFVKETDILKLIETLNCATDGIATLACPIKEDQQRKNPNRVKVVFNNRREAMYFSRYDLPYRKNESDEELSFQHIGIYGFKNEVLQILTKLPAGKYEKAESLEQLRWMEEGYKINLGFVDDSLFSVDTPEDLLEANKLVK
jgi:3-deoxy-manno-octulosonate cytidylyltransferase (CMP-KDO synthetase)